MSFKFDLKVVLNWAQVLASKKCLKKPQQFVACVEGESTKFMFFFQQFFCEKPLTYKKAEIYLSTKVKHTKRFWEEA
jgi:hypothetical protein